ncbi:tetratricopeptide repeat protein [Helicobacter mustelae]|uniref:Uncharacterized protein n=1 Tax=Helicobacter mustelae (strain ATCC 43772 / CCUG 25715 / CIP 103759 / LMG 18044 / NCTC 12198 / R85-136P) TaxID=679897 RepID=D3UI52_HELM1|nr:tetratricopeptide repeat protein [Helicobacter mustelae]CBG40175.1 Putative hypothetical protein [Helicobacter mustelae 12198]SQH71678.1 Uncharacterised protein [Helicobacter mustelae]
MFKTLTLASIYELQGHKEEALSIYQEILKKDPDNFEAKQAMKRLRIHKKFGNVNENAKKMFMQAKSGSEELKNFERWLMQWN